MKKLSTIVLVLALASLCVFAQGAEEKATAKYPTGPVEFVALGNPGGGSDLLARNIVDVITKYNLASVPVNVVDKAGGSGAVGMAYFNSKSDLDYNLMTVNSANIVTTHAAKVQIPRGGKWTPIACVATDNELLVASAESPFNNIQEVIDALKKNPKSLTVGCQDDLDAMTVALFEKEAGVEFNHTAYFASSEVFTSLLGGHIDFTIANPGECVGLVEGGRAKAIASFSPERLAAPFDKTGTVKEAGYPNCVIQMARGVMGPAGMSKEAQEYWANVLKQVCEKPEWKENYLDRSMLGNDFYGAADFEKFYADHENFLVTFATELGILK